MTCLDNFRALHVTSQEESETSSMKAGETTLNDLIVRDRQYQIPLYQRPYTWKDEHRR